MKSKSCGREIKKVREGGIVTRDNPRNEFRC